VRLGETDVRIAITDNGRGMPSGAPGNRNADGGFGLVGMVERAKAVNGTMSIDSTAGRGTTLSIVIPNEVTPA